MTGSVATSAADVASQGVWCDRGANGHGPGRRDFPPPVILVPLPVAMAEGASERLREAHPMAAIPPRTGASEWERRKAAARKDGAQGQNRTADTRIFSPLLYQLSYLGARGEALL
jgi:hypothetical protein